MEIYAHTNSSRRKKRTTEHMKQLEAMYPDLEHLVNTGKYNSHLAIVRKSVQRALRAWNEYEADVAAQEALIETSK